MGHLLLPGAPRETKISMETRARTPIPNAQYHELSTLELNLAPDYGRKYLGVKVRTGPNPIYNCHGLTFASRRTGIYDDADFRAILSDDGYTEIPEPDSLPGDVVLYFDAQGSLAHSGLVTAAPASPLHIPQIVSKWGKYGEVIHPAHVKPEVYGPERRYYRVTK